MEFLPCRQSAVCNWQPSSEAQQKEQTLIARSSERLEWGSAAALWSFLIGCGPALADVGAKYDPSQGSESVKNIAGVFYAGLLAIFAFRLLTRRAKKFREEVSHPGLSGRIMHLLEILQACSLPPWQYLWTPKPIFTFVMRARYLADILLAEG